MLGNVFKMNYKKYVEWRHSGVFLVNFKFFEHVRLLETNFVWNISNRLLAEASVIAWLMEVTQQTLNMQRDVQRKNLLFWNNQTSAS